MTLLKRIKGWVQRRRQELAARAATEAQFDALTDKGFFDRIGK